MAEIVIRNLRKEFGSFVAVQDSTFTVGDGEFFMLLGPSGCGKTTTLRMIAGLELPTSGQILLDGKDVAQSRASARDIAFVFQMFALYPHMNVRRNISYPLVSQGMGRADVRRRVAEVAKILKIEDILDRSVGGLSSGDRQRVALGRAIVREPKAFLMDEPLGALDAEFREHMAEELRALHDRMGATTVYVTHDQLEAMQMGDKIVVMNHGVVEQWGTPQEIYDRPATMFVAGFIGSPPMNFVHFDATLEPGADSIRLSGQKVPIPRIAEGVSGRKLVLGVRPEHGRCRMTARTVAGSLRPSISVRRRSSPSKRRMERSRRASRPPRRRVSARRWRCRSTPRRCRCSMPAPGTHSRPLAPRAGPRGSRTRMAAVVLNWVSKSFGDTKAVDGVSMTIPDGAFVVLLGPTGAGKTTTLRMIAGLERPDSGDVAIAGRSVLGDTPARRNVAMVFQQYSLYPHLTVRENLAFPLRSPLIKASSEHIERRIAEVAGVLQIAHKLDNRATALSGGEMQRVAIGRALVRKPQLFLMDEPLSSLDAKLRADMRIELKRIQSDLGATLLYVTHDQIEAMTMATMSASSTRAGWCSSDRRGRSTRIRRASMSPPGWASPASTRFPPACSPARRLAPTSWASGQSISGSATGAKPR